MKCVIPSANVKILARAIHALAKIGEEMYVQPQERSLSFRSVSMANSAFFDFTFRENFFSYYNYGNLNEDDALKCKIPMRGALAVFKSPGVLDKLVETCHIKLEPDAVKLIMVLKYKNSVIKTFLLPIIDCEAMKASYNKDGVPNKITVQPKILTEALHNFQQNLIEITLDVSGDKILMRNYINDTSSASNSTRTQLALAIGEFDTYTIGQDACITFCLKELRAILAFAEIVATPLHMSFQSAGSPVVFILKNIAFEANLVLSTLNPDSAFIADTSVRERKQASKKRAAPKSKKTSAKQKAPDPKSKTAKSKTNETINNILASVHNGRHSPRVASRRTADTDPFDLDSIDEPQLVSAVRSTSIHSPASVNGNIPNGRSAQAMKTPQRTDFVEQTPSTASSPQSGHSGSSKTSHSVFSSSWKRRDRASNDSVLDDLLDEDTVPNSPPRKIKKASSIFKKCFQSTFDPRMLPGHDKLLADDSDNEN